MMTKKVILSLLMVFLCLAVVSAGDLTLTNTTSKDISVTPGNNVQFSFTLNNSNLENNYTLIWTSDNDGAGSWTTVPTLAFINNNSVSSIITATLNVPAGKSPGIYHPTITVRNNSITSTLTFNVNVTPVSTITMVKTRDMSKTQNGIVTLTNTGNVASDITLSSSVSTVKLSSYSLTLNAGASATVEVNASGIGELSFGDNPVVITVAKAGVVQTSVTFTLPNTFCKYGQVGAENLSIDNVDISNSGEDDNEWMPLDVITVEVDVENNADDDVDDVIVEIALLDSDGNDVTNDIDFSNSDEEQIDLGDINDGDSETATFEFQVPADMDSGNYKLVLKTYSDGEEDSICSDRSGDLSDTTFESISIDQESDEGKFITYDNIVVDDEATCGDSLTLTADVYNVGDDDQDRVKVNLQSSNLDLSLSREITSDLNIGDKERVTFTFDIPTDTESGRYILKLSSDYDYKNGNYRQNSDEDFEVPLQIVCSSPSQPSTPSSRIAQITADVTSEAKAGQELVIDATIKNLGSNTATFVISADGYDSWATLESISSRTVSLDAGESKDVTLTFTVNKDASGEKSFEVVAISGGKTETKAFSIDITKSSSVSSLFSGGSTWLWVVGIVNVLLIILIIVVAVRLARR